MAGAKSKQSKLRWRHYREQKDEGQAVFASVNCLSCSVFEKGSHMTDSQGDLAGREVDRSQRV